MAEKGQPGDRPTYRLTVRALPDDVPPVIRLRRLLKHSLRALGFRAVSVEEVPPAPPPGGAKEEEAPP
jgi:hypothetical protein